MSADEFPTVAHVLGQTEGTLIAPQWVLTAAHTLENLDPFSRWRVILDGRDYAVSKIIMHPRRVSGSVDSDFDLALLKLEQPAHATPSPLYRWTDEPDQVALLVGRGGTKTGQRGGG